VALVQRLKATIHPGNRVSSRHSTTKAPATRRAIPGLKRPKTGATNPQPAPQTPDTDLQQIDELDAALSGEDFDEEPADTFPAVVDPLALEEDFDQVPITPVGKREQIREIIRPAANEGRMVARAPQADPVQPVERPQEVNLAFQSQ